MLNYVNTYNDVVYNMKNLDKQYLYKGDISTLYKNGVDFIKANYRVNSYIADINKLISNRINNIKELIPE